MSARPYWTEADQADLDLLVHELIRQAWPHRGEPGWDDAVCEAVEAILEWREARALRSKAAALRARQDLSDWKAAA